MSKCDLCVTAEKIFPLAKGTPSMAKGTPWQKVPLGKRYQRPWKIEQEEQEHESSTMQAARLSCIAPSACIVDLAVNVVDNVAMYTATTKWFKHCSTSATNA